MVQLRDLAPAGIGFVVIAITLSIGVEVVSDIQTDCTNTTAGVGDPEYCGYQIYGNGTQGLAEISSWLPTLGLVLAAAVVIGSVVAFFAFRR